jgi:hypothetical protein
MKLNHSQLSSTDLDWEYIDQVINPSSQCRIRRIQSIIRPKLPKASSQRTINYGSLIAIPTHNSIVKYSKASADHSYSYQTTYNCRDSGKTIKQLIQPDHDEQCPNQGSKGAHNAHLVKPGSHDHYRAGLDTGAHNAPVREPACGQEADVRLTQTRKRILTPIKPHLRPEKAINHPAVLLSNCQSLTTDKLDELKLVIEEKTPKIIMLTESWLTEDKERARQMQDYTLHTSNRSGRTGGGVAIYTHHSLDVKIVKKHSNTLLTTLWLSVKNENNTQTIYACVYHPKSKTKHQSEETLNHINNTIIELSSIYTDKFVIGGDFNHLDMSDVCTLFNLKNIVDFPTRDTAYLDHIYTNIPEIQSASCTKLPPIGSSDHSTAFLPSRAAEKPQSDFVYRRKITPQRRLEIEKDISGIEWSEMLENSDPNAQAEHLQNTVTAIVNRHCPFIRVKKQHNKTPWFDGLSRKLKNAKQKAYSRGCPTARAFSNLLRKHLRKAKKQWITKRLQDKNPKTLWRTLDTLNSKSKTKLKKYYTINNERLTQQQTAEILNSYFSSLGGSSSHVEIDTQLSEEADLPVHPGQVKSWILGINTKKATCSQDYPSWVTKMCADHLCEPLSRIFKNCLASGIYPTVWKFSEIVPLEKCKSVSLVSDFRPVSLLWHLGKLLEKCIMHFYTQAVLPGLNGNQFAYQKGKSTTDAVISAIDHWTHLLDKPNMKSVPVSFLDMSKAFDKMDRGKLVSLMLARGVNQHLVNIIHSFLSNRVQTVRVGSYHSSKQCKTNGTPQGTLLGPMFWLLYADSLETSCHIIKYADDLTLTAETAEELQQSINEVSAWCKTNNMTTNAEKSVILDLANKRCHHQQRNVAI